MSKDKNKKHMSNFKFRAILIPVMAVFLVIIVAGTICAEHWAPSLDTYLGMGTRKTSSGGASYSDEDTNYYDPSFSDESDPNSASALNGAAVSEEISDEGEILLKNDGVLPLTPETKVTPMGYRYTDPVLTGVGSGKATVSQDFVVHPNEALAEYFEVNTTVESKLSSASVVYATSEGYKSKSDDNGAFDGATTSVGEFNPDQVYSSSDIGDYKTAIVFVGRVGGEGGDLQMTPYYDNNGTKIADHELQLMPYEKATIDFAADNCDNVILIVNSANPLELGEYEDKVNAILWVGVTGCSGFESMGKILCGEVNPSGRLTDLWAKTFANDPTYNNFGYYYYTNDSEFTHRSEESGDAAHFVEYEEGIYLGYRYYETVADDMNASESGSGDTWYDENVQYPFGYGLTYNYSYEDGTANNLVSQSLTDVTYDQDTGVITVTGTVTNSSSRAAKEVVQVYYNPPYSSEGAGIEKAAKNLIAFDKVDVPANDSKDFTIIFNAEDMASYDDAGYYTGGAGSYVLEAGTYGISLGKNSHDEWGSSDITVSSTKVYYDESGVTEKTAGCTYVGKRSSDQQVATNLYSFLNDYMNSTGDYSGSAAVGMLSRNGGLTSSSTTSPSSKAAVQAVLDQFKGSAEGSYSYDGYITALYGTDNPVSNASMELSLSHLRGADYDDTMWDTLLNQLDYSSGDIDKLLSYGSFTTNEVSAIDKGVTKETDGPQAIGNTGTDDGKDAACPYPSEILIASTWNVELAEKMGVAIGEESITRGKNGWYAPACNIHRSPFAGRAYEYYSEDALLSGQMAAYTVQGAASKGFTTYIKHFAVNEQETGRVAVCTWLTEQAMREIYIKPFEIAVKGGTRYNNNEGKVETYGKIEEKYLALNEDTGEYELQTKERMAATGMMGSMNYIGARWTSLDYDLNTNLLRNEWGFNGVVITDSATAESNQLLNACQAGTDYFLSFMRKSLSDKTSAVAQWSIRQAIHNICYAVVNSNYMQGVGPGGSSYYTMSPWEIGIICMDVVLGLLIAGGIVWIILRTLDEKKNPDKYNRKAK